MMSRTTRRLTATAALAATAALLGGCDSAPAPAPAASSTRHYGAIAFEPCTWPTGSRPGTCRRSAPASRCPRTATRPMAAGSGSTLPLLPATDEGSATEDPVFFLAGGPGQSAVQVWPQLDPAFTEVRKQRHVVLVDQRGTGDSNLLACAAEDDDPQAAATPDAAAIAAFARRCAEGVADRADPRFYTTTDAIADLDAVREAIGAAKINLTRRLVRHPRGPAVRQALSATRAQYCAGRRGAERPGGRRRIRPYLRGCAEAAIRELPRTAGLCQALPARCTHPARHAGYPAARGAGTGRIPRPGQRREPQRNRQRRYSHRPYLHVLVHAADRLAAAAGAGRGQPRTATRR